MEHIPSHDQRHLCLHYQVEGYTKEIVYDFEQRLETICGRQVNRVNILDFEGLTSEIRHDLAVRLRIVYTGGDGQLVFVSHAWRRLFGIRSPLLRNEITNFCQHLDESLFEAWEHYKLSIDRCPNHNMLPVTQIDTFCNSLTLRHRDTINAAAGGTFMKKQITSLKAKMAEINKNLMRVLQVTQQVKSVTPNCETYDGPRFYNDCPATVGQTQNVYAVGAYQGGASHGQNPPPAYQAPAYQASGYQALVHQPPIPQPQVVTTNEFTNFMMANNAILKNMQTNMTSLTNSNLELKNMFGQFMKMNTASSSGLGTLPGNTVTNPKEDLKGITTRSGTVYQGPTIPTTSSSLPLIVERETEVTKDMVPPTNNRSTKDVQTLVVRIETLILNYEPIVAPIIEPVAAPFGPTIKTLLTNKHKLSELARTPLNEHSSTVLLKKLPEKLGDPDKFLILCDILGMDECLALANLGASINLMPLLVWNKLSLSELSPTALIDVFEREMPLRVGKEAITFNLDQTSRYSTNYNDMTVNRIGVIDMACEEYSQEVLGFSDVITSGNSTPYYDPIVSTSSLTLTSFGDSDFLLEEVDAFLALKDDPTLPKVELKDLPPHLEYAFLEGDGKFPIIVAKDLSVEEKTALITVLKSHKQSIAWKLSDIKGINPEFCTHKILMEEDFKPVVQHQRKVNPKIHDVIKKEVEKLLNAGLIYLISNSPWVSPVHCVPKKGGFTVVENEENELIPTRLVTGWRVCID
nr:hypothetical protein [Tanacetum cinerariifolium]